MRSTAATATLVLAGFVGLFIPAGAAAFCDSPTLVNYSAPLESLPPLRKPGLDGQLPFGPKGLLSLRPVNRKEQRNDHLVVPPEAGESLIRKALTVGYLLAAEHTLPASSPYRDWMATASLTRMSTQRKREKLLATYTRRVAPLTSEHGRELTFRLSSHPAIYRVEVAFTDGNGKTLGRFGEYLRVMQRAPDTRLTLNASQVRPGNTIAACIQNYGNTGLSYGPNLNIEAFDGAQWQRASFYTGQPEPAILYSFAPGTSRGGPGYQIPVGAAPGLYRMAVEVGGSILTAQFEILAAG